MLKEFLENHKQVVLCGDDWRKKTFWVRELIRK